MDAETMATRKPGAARGLPPVDRDVSDLLAGLLRAVIRAHEPRLARLFDNPGASRTMIWSW